MGTGSPSHHDTHYHTLGVSPDASPAEVRKAYRALARRYHPDARGGVTSPEITAINAAWHVLSHPGRKAAYDASLKPSAPRWEADTMPVPPTPRRVGGSVMDPPRFPWRLAVWMAVVGSLGVVVLSWLSQPSAPRPVNNLLTPGSCVVVEPGEMAREVACSGPHDAVVQVLVPFDSFCPSHTSTLRDRQGLGWACVLRVEGA
jgi:hypothetical protein